MSWGRIYVVGLVLGSIEIIIGAPYLLWMAPQFGFFGGVAAVLLVLVWLVTVFVCGGLLLTRPWRDEESV